MAIKSVLGGDYSLEGTSDDALVELARSGGSRTGAWDELYRRHANSARSVARHILHSRQDADDVVNDAFAGVIAAIGRGLGPRTNFRQYLMACVRNGCKTRAWRGSRTVALDPDALERYSPVFEDPEQFGEAGLIADAFSTLATDWQRALWLTAVEERPTEDVARELGRRPAAVAALAFRAREAFAVAYLSQHQQRVATPSCVRISPKLAHYVRGRAGDIDTARVEHHLERCQSCTRAVSELRDVNSSLRSLALPVTLVGTGTAIAAAAPFAVVGATTGLVGWTASAIGAATLAKVAVLVALVVPAALLITDSTQNRSLIRETAVSDSGAGGGRVDPADSVASDSAPEEIVTTTVEQARSTSSSVVAEPAATPRSPRAAVADPAVASTEPTVSDRGVVDTLPVATTSVPVSTTPAVVIPVSTPSVVSAPAIIAPVLTTPAISAPAISTPAISTPAIDTPIVTVPSLTVPSTTVPVLIVVPALSTPASTAPPLAVVPLTAAELPLPSLPPLPLPKLPIPGLPFP